MAAETPPTPTADGECVVDKCAVCNMYFVVSTLSDLRRRVNAHELSVHGSTQPTRSDHTDTDYR
jgi:hypothetical protein